MIVTEREDPPYGRAFPFFVYESNFSPNGQVSDSCFKQRATGEKFLEVGCFPAGPVGTVLTAVLRIKTNKQPCNSNYDGRILPGNMPKP